MKSWLKNHPKTQIVTGASTGKILQKKDAIKATARTSKNGTVYEIFNTALLITDKQETQIFHKSKLVPGAEMTPFSYILKPFFDKFPMKIGGSIGNFGTNDSLQNFASFKGTFTPTICYESIYGEYVSSFHSLGSNWICIITNDGWWGNTFGHQQHQSYARLRAIENRKYVIRSANTGISSVINPMGKVEQLLPYGKEGIIESEITKHNRVTFYAKHGDYIGRLASFLGIIYLLQLILVILKNNVTHLKNE
jgi:apolipoprotein N-acyltransferase